MTEQDTPDPLRRGTAQHGHMVPQPTSPERKAFAAKRLEPETARDKGT